MMRRRELLVATPAVVAAWQLAGCAAETLHDGESSIGQKRDAASTSSRIDYEAYTCSDKPTAYVFKRGSGELYDALEAAGFELVTLPLDRSPIELRGMIVFPAFASEDAAYAKYMESYAEALYNFVDAANVLVQLAQAQEREAAPPFLPTTHTARRTSAQVERIRVVDTEHPLAAGFAVEKDGLLALQRADAAVDAFASQDGFEVILADDATTYPVLMEGAYGQGRFVLSALSFDYAGDAQGLALTYALCTSLFDHVQRVCDRSVPALEITMSKTIEVFKNGSQLLAVMPDTQVYSLRLPGLLGVQTTWIREHAEKLDIRYALQLGDTTNNNTATEWQRAATAFGQLRGVVPYAIAPGNHDYGPSGNASTRETRLNDHFAFDEHSRLSGFGGAYEKGRLDNTYHLFSIGGRDVVLLALEWAPRDEVIAWANQVMLDHPERDGILITHAYLNNDDRRYDHTDKAHSQRYNPHEYRTPGTINDGEQLWQKLIKRHRFIMTLNGHVLGDGCGYLASTTDAGNTCHQMLSNYQMRNQGGDGYLRLLEFLDDGHSLRVRTYSPLYDKFLDEPKQNFSVTLD